ncbi:MAG: response regulator [Janthinobacterium lividum]
MESTIRALIVDDDIEIRQLLQSYLGDFGIEAQAVNDGGAMRAAMASTTFHLIILDVMLPGENGLMLCKQLRATSNIPIIMLTARGEATDRVVGLELGADDYVQKPFDPRELVARIHTVLRRSNLANAAQAVASQVESADEDREQRSEETGFEGWRLNRTTRQLTSPTQVVVPLSNAEFRLLWTFIERPRRVLTRDQLMDAARGQLSNAFDRSIDLLVSRLRQKLDDDPRDPRLLKTIRGEGYLFDARITR